MKKDIDALMEKRDLDALLVLGSAENNPPMYYFTGGGHISAAALIKKRDEEPVLFCNDMERDEATKTGLKTRLFSEYPFMELYKETGGDKTKTNALMLARMLTEFGLSGGRIGIYGHVDLSSNFGQLMALRDYLPELTLVGEPDNDSVFLRAMETKDESEVERIRRMGAITTEVVGLTADYLTSCDVSEDEVLLQEDGTPLTIATMKAKINLWLAERGAVPSEGFIFAIGADAGVPHSQGNPDDLLRLGQTIVYDIYPQEQGGGYFFDFTRTWSLGYTTPEAQKLYAQVLDVYNKVVQNMDLNAPFMDYQALTCEEFGKYGHATPKNGQAPKEGYVHSLGHGLGINVHERPFSGVTAREDDRLVQGVVITVEPGLYYPSKGMGFRIEDSYWVRPDGRFEILAEYGYDFVLDMKKWKR